jgi:glycosyltransferase involved in cell wall biosynthesis
MHLLLLMSYGGSLEKWHREGILTREFALYHEHLSKSHVSKLTVFTYGTNDRSVLDTLNLGTEIHSRIQFMAPTEGNPKRFGRLAHSMNIRLLRQLSHRCDLVKTNQISGAWAAIILALLRLPVFARCGYILSRRHWLNGRYFHATTAWLVEFLLFNLSRNVSVTTGDASRFATRMRFGRRGVFVAPTYVDVDVFKPGENASRRLDAIFVGRLEKQKNVLKLVEAAGLAAMNLTIIGSGGLRQEVEKACAASPVEISLIDKMTNNEIAKTFDRHRMFVLPSLQEGLPKVLIEAMSSGLVCVGTNIPGIRDLLVDGVTGYLAPSTSAADLAAAMKRATSDSESAACAKRAREYVLNHHSLASYAEREYQAFQKCIGRKN